MVHFAEELVSTVAELLEGVPSERRVRYGVRAGEGVSATEAPRGLLIHHYRIDERGRVEMANIVTPTAQNYKNMEADAVAYATALMEGGVKELEFELEKLIRAYDPCISCSAHVTRIGELG